MSSLAEHIPPMLVGAELNRKMAVYPSYDPDIRKRSVSERLIALDKVNMLYVPSAMSGEVYSRLYLSLLRSLRRKDEILTCKQKNANHKTAMGNSTRGIMGGADSFTVIGESGIGKSATISRAVELMEGNTLIEEKNRGLIKIIPCLNVQCPFDSSVKGMLLEILRKADEELESDYYEHALKIKSTTDVLIGLVSQVALDHIGVLIVDEIQNVVNSRNGKNLVGSLTQLLNSSGISVCMVGIPESSVFFEQEMYLARRSLGLHYKSLSYDEFLSVCNIIWSYQYTSAYTELTEAVRNWLYEHTNGNVSMLLAVIMSAQETAIQRGTEIIDIPLLNEVFSTRMSFLRDYAEPQRKKIQPRRKKQEKALNIVSDERMESGTDYVENNAEALQISLPDLIQGLKMKNMDGIQCLRPYFSVEEVAV